ncbi:hypothetical protein ACS0TY_014150 [Phlomoides rotata]
MISTNLKSLFLLITLILISHQSSAQPHTTLVAPLKKDVTTSLPTIILNSDEHYVIDLSAAFSWWRCPSRHHPTVGCFTSGCIQATYLFSTYCSLLPPPSTSTPCTCIVTPVNPIAKSCEIAQLTSRNFTLSSTNNAKITLNDTYLSCASRSIFSSFPRGALGLASLSLAPLSLPSQFTSFLGVSNKFALCLPSSTVGNGVAFFGNGPYKLRSRATFNVSDLLSYTQLIRNPKSADYFIGINAIIIGGKSILLSPYEGIKLSTVVPYTILRTDVYKPVVEFFTDGMKGVPRAKKAAPFTICYNASFDVPRIDLQFDDAKNWTMYRANSMKKVGDSACLAFLDGGETTEHKIVIGSYQMEDNFLLFDIDQSRLGFTSSLNSNKISCSNF